MIAATVLAFFLAAAVATAARHGHERFDKTHPKAEGCDDVIGRGARACRRLLGERTALGLPAATQVRPPAFRVTSDLEAVRREGRAGAEPSNSPTAVYWHRRFLHMRHLAYVRGQRVHQLKRILLARPSVSEAINLACVVYGNCSTLWRKARCESGLNPGAVNAGSRSSGLFQFLPSTWATTPFGSFSILSPYASALAAGWMHANGRGGEWSCR